MIYYIRQTAFLEVISITKSILQGLNNSIERIRMVSSRKFSIMRVAAGEVERSKLQHCGQRQMLATIGGLETMQAKMFDVELTQTGQGRALLMLLGFYATPAAWRGIRSRPGTFLAMPDPVRAFCQATAPANLRDWCSTATFAPGFCANSLEAHLTENGG